MWVSHNKDVGRAGPHSAGYWPNLRRWSSRAGSGGKMARPMPGRPLALARPLQLPRQGGMVETKSERDRCLGRGWHGQQAPVGAGGGGKMLRACRLLGVLALALMGTAAGAADPNYPTRS